MINGAGEETFEYLVSILGPSGAHEFLETALPEVIQRNSTLQATLTSQDYNQAIQCANQSLGAVRFYGSKELEQLLLLVASGMGSSDPMDTRNKLSIAFEVVIGEINTWIAANPAMKATTPHDRYSSHWTAPYLDVFFDGKFTGRVCASGLEEAKKIFEVVAQGQAPLEDIIRFNEAAQGMIGVDLSAMSFSVDRQQILYNGHFFTNA